MQSLNYRDKYPFPFPFHLNLFLNFKYTFQFFSYLPSFFYYISTYKLRIYYSVFNSTVILSLPNNNSHHYLQFFLRSTSLLGIIQFYLIFYSNAKVKDKSYYIEGPFMHP